MTSKIDPGMTYNMSSGMLNFTIRAAMLKFLSQNSESEWHIRRRRHRVVVEDRSVAPV